MKTEYLKSLWIPITERLPEPGRKVLFVSYDWADEDVCLGYMRNKDVWIDIEHPTKTFIKANYWMSLPEPPKP